MSKKNIDAHTPKREVNNVAPKQHRVDRAESQKNQGDRVVKWIFGVLIFLAIIYMIWTFYIM